MATFTTTQESRYEHDCTVCHFVGTHGEYDLWVHANGDYAALIARFNNDRPDYKSLNLAVFRSCLLNGIVDNNDPMLACYHRALGAELI